MPNKKFYEYDHPNLQNKLNESSNILNTAWAKVTPEFSLTKKQIYKNKIKNLLKQKNAILVAHYYVDANIQEIAEETNGLVGDSLEMAKFGKENNAKILVVAGVKFMGETAKILSPEKTILMPDLEAQCSLDLGCPPNEFKNFCDQYPDRLKVVYANTSAQVKAQADWMVTSSIGLKIIEHLKQQGKKIIWAPDRHLGEYIKSKTKADIIIWQGSCLVHNEFKGQELKQMKSQHPNAKILAHPEAPAEVAIQADVVGSTTQLIKATQQLKNSEFIVATDLRIIHQMKKLAPNKVFLPAPTAGNSATCKSCAFCPWMSMNHLENLYECIKYQINEINLPAEIINKAKIPIERMLNFAKQN